jgi:magnesium transporter
MQREFLAAPQFWTVGHTIDHVRASSEDLPELFFDVYVVDPAYKPVGAVPVSTLLRSKRGTRLEEIMEAVNEITVDQDQEEVGYIFDKYHLISAPVVDDGGRLVGQITVDDIVGVIAEETEEDILALAGVSDAGRDASVWGIARSRLPWLVVNTGTAALAVSVIQAFQEEIAKLVTLAVLMPVVAGQSGNTGAQALAVTMRGLALREIRVGQWFRVTRKEAAVAFVNGWVIALTTAAGVLVWSGSAGLSFVVGIAMLMAMVAAGIAGVIIPMMLTSLGQDPAQSSSIFLTTVTDVVGFSSFLGLATLLSSML